MEVRVEVGGIRLDKALADLTDLSRSVANEQIKMVRFWSMDSLKS